MENKSKRLFKTLLRVFSFILFLFNSSMSFGQAREESSSNPSATASSTKKGFQLDKVVVGGNFGAQFGDIVLVEISPTAGYQVTERWVTGVGARYIYQQFRTTAGSFSTNIYGGTVFNQFVLLDQLLAHAELEYLSLENFAVPNERINIFSPLVGAGYRQNIGREAFVNVLVLFNLNDDINSPYSNPILRVNFAFGL